MGEAGPTSGDKLPKSVSLQPHTSPPPELRVAYGLLQTDLVFPTMVTEPGGNILLPESIEKMGVVFEALTWRLKAL